MDKCPIEGGRIDRLPTRPRNEVKVSGGGGGSLESKFTVQLRPQLNNCCMDNCCMDRCCMEKCRMEKCHWTTCQHSRMVPQSLNGLYGTFPGGVGEGCGAYALGG